MRPRARSVGPCPVTASLQACLVRDWPGVSGGEGLDHEHHPEALAAEVSLPTATIRLTCSVAATPATPPPTRVSDDDENGWASFRDTSLDTYEALELLTLGERWSPGRRTTAS